MEDKLELLTRLQQELKMDGTYGGAKKILDSEIEKFTPLRITASKMGFEVNKRYHLVADTNYIYTILNETHYVVTFKDNSIEPFVGLITQTADVKDFIETNENERDEPEDNFETDILYYSAENKRFIKLFEDGSGVAYSKGCVDHNYRPTIHYIEKGRMQSYLDAESNWVKKDVTFLMKFLSCDTGDYYVQANSHIVLEIDYNSRHKWWFEGEPTTAYGDRFDNDFLNNFENWELVDRENFWVMQQMGPMEVDELPTNNNGYCSDGGICHRGCHDLNEGCFRMKHDIDGCSKGGNKNG